MKTYKLNEKDKELISMAKETIKKNARENEKVAISVGCALVSKSGKTYKGVNVRIKSSAPTSICAEMSAIAGMVSDGEKEIQTIVSFHEKTGVDPPCGACRHIIYQFGNPFVIISKDKKVKLMDIYPRLK